MPSLLVSGTSQVLTDPVLIEEFADKHFRFKVSNRNLSNGIQIIQYAVPQGPDAPLAFMALEILQSEIPQAVLIQPESERRTAFTDLLLDLIQTSSWDAFDAWLKQLEDSVVLEQAERVVARAYDAVRNRRRSFSKS
jgi:hypothetical protein